MLMYPEPHPHPTRKIDWRLVMRLIPLFFILFCTITLLPFYRWVLFQQTGRRRVSVLWATHFLFTHGWRDLLMIGAAELSWSVGASLIVAMMWNTWERRLSRKKASNVLNPDTKLGVWPPPPNVPE